MHPPLPASVREEFFRRLEDCPLAALALLLTHVERLHSEARGGYYCPFCEHDATVDGHDPTCPLPYALAAVPTGPFATMPPGYAAYGYSGRGLEARIRDLERLIADPLCPNQIELETQIAILKSARPPARRVVPHIWSCADASEV